MIYNQGFDSGIELRVKFEVRSLMFELWGKFGLLDPVEKRDGSFLFCSI